MDLRRRTFAPVKAIFIGLAWRGFFWLGGAAGSPEGQRCRSVFRCRQFALHTDGRKSRIRTVIIMQTMHGFVGNPPGLVHRSRATPNDIHALLRWGARSTLLMGPGRTIRVSKDFHHGEGREPRRITER